MTSLRSAITVCVVLSGWHQAALAQTGPIPGTEIHLSVSPVVAAAPLTGRLYVMFERDVYTRPIERFMPGDSSFWFAADVRDWQPGAELVMTGDVVSYPHSLADLPPGDYAVQAVLDIDTTARGFADAPGNLTSDVAAAVIRSQGQSVVRLVLGHRIEDKRVDETAFLRELTVPSARLSAFLGRPTSVAASVVLPPSYYRDPEQRFATVFVMPGFGSPYTAGLEGDFQRHRYGMNSVGREKVFVFLDLECPLGDHEFVDSANNGPWASALMEEFIPELERRYRVFGEPATRFLTGQSSGAWAGLWLQVTYPDQFGGVWACSPDPVDFEQFLGVNIYQPGANLLFDRTGEPIELNTLLSKVTEVIGDGWALSTFEAVFSPRGDDGRPRQLWDRRNGAIDAAVAASWQRYDLRRVLHANWDTLGPRVAGKIHIFVADDDPFGLDEAVSSLAAAMADLDHDLEIVVFDHGGHDLWTDELRERIHHDIDERIARIDPAPSH